MFPIRQRKIEKKTNNLKAKIRLKHIHLKNHLDPLVKNSFKVETGFKKKQKN